MILNHLVGGLMNKILIALVLLAGLSGNVFAQKLSDKELQRALKGGMERQNAQTPKRLDEWTYLMGVTKNRKTLSYHYQYTLSRSELEKQINYEWGWYKSELQKGIINSFCTHEDLKLFRDNNVNMIYKYSDKDKIYLFQIPVDKSYC